MNNNMNRKRKPCFPYKDAKNIGFVLIVFGGVTVLAFFLPPRAWILLLGTVLVYCGVALFRKY